MTTEKSVLVADDEPHMRRVLEIALRKMGHRVLVAGNGREAADIVQAGAVDLVITDLRMPVMDGLALLRHLRAMEFDVPVIVITAHGSVESAVEAMKQGASEYLLRPFDLDVLELAVERTLRGADVSRHNRFLRQELERGWGDAVGQSLPMQQVGELIRKVAPTKAAVMIVGETGTGKELAARAVHMASPRADRLFVPVNCAAIPAEMLESELFGYEKGAFTGAVKERIGKFELANEGTLFLDELTEMPIEMQAKLLRALQENTIERLGGNRRIALDIRVIAATNRSPREAIAQGKLREDLYYRVNVFTIDLPPLRERRDDIPGLVAHFIAKHGHRRVTPGEIDPQVLERLQGYAWPGNVRELENVIERALILAGPGQLQLAHLRLDAAAAPAAAPAAPVAADPGTQALPPPGPLNAAVEALEARLIERALQLSEGSKPRAAALLDISERALWYKLKKYRVN
ncbi:sigma-54-dependent transcriptional regulator [Aquabacterium sp.]|uniref:sigma-54-dependent transcriptional regulator n=1 Tax=Aquabacterium sp. TaxID=1872578 RepID=UPI003784E9C3